MGIQIKVLKIEGVPLGHSIYFSLKFKDENDETSVIPYEARTGRSVIVNSDYPVPEWKNEPFYFKPVLRGNTDTTKGNYPTEEAFIEKANPKFYVFSKGSVYDSRVASGRISFRVAIPGKTVREVFHLEGIKGFVPQGRSVAVTLELLQDINDEMMGVGSVMGRAPPTLSPTSSFARHPSGGISPRKDNNNGEPTSPATAGGKSVPQSPTKSTQPSPSPTKKGSVMTAAAGGNAPSAARSHTQSRHASVNQQAGSMIPDGEEGVDVLLEGLQRTFPILEQRLHIVTRSLDRRDRQLLDMRSRLVGKSNSVNLLTEEVNKSTNRNMELSDKITDLESELSSAIDKAAQASALEQANKKLTAERDSTVEALKTELHKQRERAEEATRAEVSLSKENDRLRHNIAQRDADVANGVSLGSNAELFAEKTIAEARVHGLTAELSECRDQLSRARARETALFENISHLTTYKERLSYEVEKSASQLADVHRLSEKSFAERHAKINELLSRQDAEVKQAREEKESALRDVDRIRVQLNESDLTTREAENDVRDMKRRQRELLNELEEVRGELIRAKEDSRLDVAGHQSELNRARENEISAKRIEVQCSIDLKNLRVQLQETDRQKQRLKNEVDEARVQLEAANRRASDLEADIKKERGSTENAVQQSRDIMEASTSETLRMGEMLKISQELASQLAEQLRSERLLKESAETDKERIKNMTEAEKKAHAEKFENERADLIAKEGQRVFAFQFQSLATIERTTRESFSHGGLEVASPVIHEMLDYALSNFMIYEGKIAKLSREVNRLNDLVEQFRREKEEGLENEPDTCEMGCDPVEELIEEQKQAQEEVVAAAVAEATAAITAASSASTSRQLGSTPFSPSDPNSSSQKGSTDFADKNREPAADGEEVKTDQLDSTHAPTNNANNNTTSSDKDDDDEEEKKADDENKSEEKQHEADDDETKTQDDKIDKKEDADDDSDNINKPKNKHFDPASDAKAEDVLADADENNEETPNATTTDDLKKEGSSSGKRPPPPARPKKGKK